MENHNLAYGIANSERIHFVHHNARPNERVVLVPRGNRFSWPPPRTPLEFTRPGMVVTLGLQ